MKDKDDGLVLDVNAELVIWIDPNGKLGWSSTGGTYKPKVEVVRNQVQEQINRLEDRVSKLRSFLRSLDEFEKTKNDLLPVNTGSQK